MDDSKRVIDDSGKPRIRAEKLTEEIKKALIKGLGYKECFNAILCDFSVSEPTFQKYWKITKEEHDQETRERLEAIQDKELEEWERLYLEQVIDKGKHARELFDAIKEMREQIQELRKVKVKRQVEGKTSGVTQSEVTAAKRTITQLYKEIREHRRLIGEWYGFPATAENLEDKPKDSITKSVDLSGVDKSRLFELADAIQKNYN